jgi:DNA-binding NarL/FixJ family response regulator
VGLSLLIVDDNASFRDEARDLLEVQGLRVVGVAADAASALALAQSARPDVALVDVELGDTSGITVAQALARADARLRVILVSAYPEEDLPGIVEQASVLGFIDKSLLSRAEIERLLETASAPPDR